MIICFNHIWWILQCTTQITPHPLDRITSQWEGFRCQIPLGWVHLLALILVEEIFFIQSAKYYPLPCKHRGTDSCLLCSSSGKLQCITHSRVPCGIVAQLLLIPSPGISILPVSMELSLDNGQISSSSRIQKDLIPGILVCW